MICEQSLAIMSLTFDRYLRYAELTEALQQLAAQFPHLMELRSIGKSFEGRDIWCAVVTSGGDDREKPALWIDGNIHASELSASSACLHILVRLLHGQAEPELAYILKTRTLYVVPRVNPDGAELSLADKPIFLRSSVRPYPYDEEPNQGLQVEDLDGGSPLGTRAGDRDPGARMVQAPVPFHVRRLARGTRDDLVVGTDDPINGRDVGGARGLGSDCYRCKDTREQKGCEVDSHVVTSEVVMAGRNRRKRKSALGISGVQRRAPWRSR